MTKIVFAASIEFQVGWQDVAIFVEKALQPAEMIVVAVAYDQRVDLGGIDAGQLYVVEKHAGV